MSDDCTEGVRVTHTEPANPDEAERVAAIVRAVQNAPTTVARGIVAAALAAARSDAVRTENERLRAERDEAFSKGFEQVRRRCMQAEADLAAARVEVGRVWGAAVQRQQLAGNAHFRDFEAVAERDAARVEVDTLRAKIEALRPLSNEATQGDWFAASREDDEDQWYLWAGEGDEPHVVAHTQFEGARDRIDEEGSDAEFVAASVNFVRAALAGAVPGSPPEQATERDWCCGHPLLCEYGGCAPAAVGGSPETPATTEETCEHGEAIDRAIEWGRSVAQEINVLPMFRALGVIGDPK